MGALKRAVFDGLEHHGVLEVQKVTHILQQEELWAVVVAVAEVAGN